MYDLVIIGGGVAGLTASIYAASRGMKVAVLESEGRGGVIGKVSLITHFPGVFSEETGKDYYVRLLKQVMQYKVDLKLETVTSVDFNEKIKLITTNKSSYKTKSVIVANGTTPNKLGLFEEVEYLHHGISYTAIDDVKNFKNCEVFVVGGSDGALKEALFISNFASKVHLVHFEDDLTGIDEFKSQIIDNKKFELHLNSRIHKLYGDGKFLQRVILKNEKDNSKKEFKFAKTCIFIYIGSSPNTIILNGQLQLIKGYILTDESMKTNIDGVYAAGDIRHKNIRQVATAANDGAIAAISAYNYVKKLVE